MDKKNLKLTELISLDLLQELQDSFAAMTRVTAVVIDPEGNKITKTSNWDGFCSLFQQNEATAGECKSYTCRLALEARDAGCPQISRCPHIGMTTAAAPIFVEGAYLGSWIFAQMRLEDLHHEQIIHAAHSIGLSNEETEVKLQCLPVYSMHEFERYFVFAASLTKSIAELSHKNLELDEKNKEVKGVTEQLAIRDAVLTRLTQISREAFYISDFYTGEMLMVNDAFCRLVGKKEEELLGVKCWETRGHKGDSFCGDCPRLHLLGAAGELGNNSVVEYYNHSYERWLRCTHEYVTWSRGRAAHMVTLEDMTAEYEMRKKLVKMAYYDDVTELPNKNKLKEDFKNPQNRAGRRAIGIVLSSLKLITDVYGTATEEQILAAIMKWFLAMELPDFSLYHLQRDEYLLMFREDELHEAAEVAQLINERFTRPWLVNIGGNRFSFVVSVAVIVLNCQVFFSTQQEVMKIVDRMFAQARKRDGLQFYDEQLDRDVQRINRLHIALEFCVKRNMQGFSVAYQPIMELSTGKWKGVEALCRWSTPEQGPISPAVFIPEAEKMGLIMPIGMWVMETAVKTMKKMGLDAIPGFTLNVNMSPTQMMDENFALKVSEILKKYDYDGQCLTIEITESSETAFNDFTLSVIESLRQQGVKLALDDFGTGYSSFNHLKHLPVSYLKTERDFIQGIEKDSYLQYFVFVLSEIAHAHGMKLIAEGVETEEQLKAARSNGADFIQGYFFSKPLSAEELEKQKDGFVRQSSALVRHSAKIIDIKHWFSGKSACEFTPAAFRLLHQCMEFVLEEHDVEKAFQSVLELAGRHTGVSRAFVFLREPGGLYSNRYEWLAEGASSHQALLQGIDVQQTAPSMVEAFTDDGMIIASDIDMLPHDLSKELRPLGVQAAALMPLWRDGSLTGFVGFERNEIFEWQSDDIVTLWNLKMTVANLLGKEELEKETIEKKNMLDAFVQNPDLFCYASDPTTYEVLWFNDNAATRGMEGGEIKGLKCYELIGGRSSPCPQCPLAELQRKPALSRAARTVYSGRLNKTLVCYDCLLPSKEGRLIHMCYAFDVTGKELVAV